MAKSENTTMNIKIELQAIAKDIDYMKSNITDLRLDVSEIKKKLEENYIKKEEMEILEKRITKLEGGWEKIAWVIGLAFLSAVLSFVLKK